MKFSLVLLLSEALLFDLKGPFACAFPPIDQNNGIRQNDPYDQNEKFQSFILGGTSVRKTEESNIGRLNELHNLRITRQPTHHPTKNPTNRPTNPTYEPTEEPSSKPTQNPSPKPSVKPTKLPTNMPTQNPTKSPTMMPTMTPTRKLPQQVTRRPTVSPTRSPSIVPSLTPSTEPSLTPSTEPSNQPSPSPSELPSFQPTSTSPTQSPSTEPTSLPSTLPSSQPSFDPTSLPTENPTHKPTLSLTPSSEPSYLPSEIPSIMPTYGPTQTPTTSSPSSIPSSIPSFEPTSLPSKSPSDSPSTNPSNTPSLSLEPTSQPSSSLNPTGSPIQSVQISTFNLVLSIDNVDGSLISQKTVLHEEFESIIHGFLLKQIVLELPPKFEVRQLDLDVVLVSGGQRKLVQRREQAEAIEFFLSGKVVFTSDMTPSTENIDAIIWQSFEGGNLILCLSLLQEAKDPFLRLTKDITAASFKGISSMNSVISYEQVPAGSNESLYIALLTVASVCLIAFAAVFLTFRGRQQSRGVNTDNIFQPPIINVDWLENDEENGLSASIDDEMSFPDASESSLSSFSDKNSMNSLCHSPIEAQTVGGDALFVTKVETKIEPMKHSESDLKRKRARERMEEEQQKHFKKMQDSMCTRYEEVIDTFDEGDPALL